MVQLSLGSGFNWINILPAKLASASRARKVFIGKSSPICSKSAGNLTAAGRQSNPNTF